MATLLVSAYYTKDKVGTNPSAAPTVVVRRLTLSDGTLTTVGGVSAVSTGVAGLYYALIPTADQTLYRYWGVFSTTDATVDQQDLPFLAIDQTPAPTAGVVADAVWDEPRAGHANAGTYGELTVPPTVGAVAGGVWDEPRAGHATAGTYGELTIPPTAGVIADAVWDEPRAGHVASGSYGEIVTATASAVWDEERVEHVASGTYGELLLGYQGSVNPTGTTSTAINLGTNGPAVDLAGMESGVEIVEGLGAGQSRKFTAYNSGTKIGTVAAWTITPDATSKWVLLPGPLPGGAVASVTAPVTLGADSITSTVLAASAGTEIAAAVWAHGSKELTAFSFTPAVADAVWDELRSGHAVSGSYGELAPGGAAPTALENAAAVWNLPTRSLSATGLNNIIVETAADTTTVNARQALTQIFAAATGVLSGAGTGTITIKGGKSNTTRLVAVVDDDGNRTSVTQTLPA